MKKNKMLRMFLILGFTSFVVACKKESEVVVSMEKPKPSIFAKWNWIKTVMTSSTVGTIISDPQSEGYTITLLLNSDSSFYKMKQTMSTTTSNVLEEGKFKFFDLRASGGGGSTNAGTATAPDEITTRIQFNDGDSLPIGIYPNLNIFDTIVIHNKAKTIADTYVRTK